MKKLFILMMLFVLINSEAMAQTSFRYKAQTLTTGKDVLYVNPKKKTDRRKFTFSDVKDALRYCEATPSATHRTLYIEPSVYWIDNPDDPNVRIPEKGNAVPFGMTLKLSGITMVGLSDDAQDVVLASNRGQTQGADGNFTMLHITGDSISAENITFGNYCNVDLVYPRNSKLNRPKRKEAIVQAQLAICRGRGYSMRNCRFISRLNLCPFVGVNDIVFEGCYFECTDDALAGNAIYRHCRFTFFSSKPFYTTNGNGARFFDCDIHTKTSGTQYLTKVSGPVTMENCRWTSDDPQLRIEWAKRADPRNYCAMKGCTLNGKPLDVPTPTEPLTWDLPAVPMAVQRDVRPGAWTMDCYKPKDTEKYAWSVNPERPAWGYAQGIDGAENTWGMVQLQRGARLMFTPRDTTSAVSRQQCVVEIDPCKGPGQGFGSATGQYMDVCIKFDTRHLTGYGLRFMRVPDYDHSVVVYLVEYKSGDISALTEPVRCDLFKPGCVLTLKADGRQLSALIAQAGKEQSLTAEMPNPNTFAGFHLQHTGSTGASAAVIKSITIK